METGGLFDAAGYGPLWWGSANFVRHAIHLGTTGAGTLWVVEFNLIARLNDGPWADTPAD
jgi:hypothetical protein